MKTIIPVAVILGLITANQHKIKTSCMLSTLNEDEDNPTIDVDLCLSITQMQLNLVATINLHEEDGKLLCSGVDMNTENTQLIIQVKDSSYEFELDGETYTAAELSEQHSMHSAILNSPLATLHSDTVDHMLKQILPEYAVSSV